MRRLTKLQRTTAALLLAVAAAAILGGLLPSGMPAGVLVLGAALGGLEALTAVGLVLIYRSARIINFSQVAIGGLASASAVLLVAGWGVPYGIAMLLGLLVAAGTGALIELAVVRRFWDRSRLVFTVATIGVALILGALRIALPGLFADLGPTDGFKFPATVALEVGPVIISADHLVAILVVPVALTALWLFLERTRAGTALRAMADAPDRARLLGIPLRKLSLLTWVTAACLSGIATMLAVPMVGVNLGDVPGGQALLIPLAAAVVARMERIGVAALAAVGIGMLDQVVFWNYPRSSTVDVVLFGVVLVALMAQRRGPADRSHKAPAFVVRPPPKLPVQVASLPQVRIGRVMAWLALAAGVLLLPIWFDNSQLSFAANLAVYGMLAISLNVLTGWGGMVGLGQFAFAGIGGSATAFVLAELGLDALIALPVGMIVGALVAGLVALPAIRFQPLFFAVTTFALAVPVASWLLNPTNFALLTPSSLERPVIAGRWDLQSPLSYYYFCLAGVVLVIAAQLNLRRSRVGRSIIATRDNPQVAASMSISPNGSLMTAVFISGAMAALAGGIWVIGLRSVPFNAFSPEASIQLFTMVVIGGLGSTLGVLLGAAYVWSVDFYLRGAAQLLATGAGMLVLLMVMPEGLAGAIYRARDRLAQAVLRHREPEAAAGLAGPPAPAAESSRTEKSSHGVGSTGDRDPTATPLLSVDGLDAGYSHMPVLDSVGFSLAEGTITALVGPNGSGKTTTLRAISGLLPAQSGSIRLAGENLEDATASDRVEHGLATVFGGEDVFGSLSVADNLLLGNWLGRSPDPDAVLELFPELERRRDSSADTLSGGERQMLTIAQALLTQPRVLLIDEMSLGLSPARVAGIKDVVRRLARDRNVTVLVVEQSAEVVTDLADSIIEIDRGRVGVAGSGPAQGANPPPGVVHVRPAGPQAEAGDSTRPVLALEGVSVRHGGVEALAGVDLELRPNEILGLIGANGAGKTTLLDACSGFARPASGSIRLLGEDVTRSSPSSRSTRGLGRVFQQAVMYPTLTVAEVLSVARERFITARDPLASALRLPHVAASEERVRAEVDEILDVSGLRAERETLFEDLPLGVRRRVQLWAALAHEPEVLILDEPTAGLASDEASEIGEFVRELPRTQQVSILITEHDLPLVLAVSERLVAMDRGRVIADGTPDRVMDDPAVRASYLGITTRPEDS